MQQRFFLLQILLLAQHVSGTTMPIIRSSRVLYGGCCLWYFVLWFAECCSILKTGHTTLSSTPDQQLENHIEHLYRIYSIPTRDKQQWLLLQFIVLLMMDAMGVRNIYSIPAVVNKHNTARVASCSFVMYYILLLFCV